MNEKLPAVTSTLGGDILSNPALFEHTWRVAKAYASSGLVPKHLQGEPESCLVALDMARVLNENPLVVLQNIFFINNRAGWYTQYLISRANKSGELKGRINWRTEGEGKSLTVTAFATLADTGEEISATVSMEMAEKEEWTRNKKYASMPEHMLKWRSAAFLVRLHIPDVMFGLPTADELEDMKFAGTLEEDEHGTYGPAPPRPTRNAPGPEDDALFARAMEIAETDGVSTDEAMAQAREEAAEGEEAVKVEPEPKPESEQAAEAPDESESGAPTPKPQAAQPDDTGEPWYLQATMPKKPDKVPVGWLDQDGKQVCNWDPWIADVKNVVDHAPDLPWLNGFYEIEAVAIENLGREATDAAKALNDYFDNRRGVLAQAPK